MPLWTKDVAAYLFVGTGASALLFQAVAVGTAGNAVTVTIAVSGDNTSLSASHSGNDVTINLATNASGVATSTVNDVITCVNTTSGVDGIIVASKGLVGAGTGLVSALSKTSLANGVSQSAPNYVDSFAASDGWRSNLTGELLVAIAENKPDVDLIGDGATVQNAIIRDNFFGRGTPYHYYDQGTQPAAADVIELLVEFNQAVTVNTNPVAAIAASLSLGSGNSEIKFTAVNPGTGGNSITVTISSGSGSYPSVVTTGNNIVITLSGTSGLNTVANVVGVCLNDNMTRALVHTSTTGDGTGTLATHSQTSLSSGANATVDLPTIPIAVGSNDTVLTYIGPLSNDQTQGYGSLLFGYTVQNSDSATAGEVLIGSGAVAATHAFGSSNSEITFTAAAPGTAGNSIQIKLNAPVSANVGAISSSISGTQITYNLTTSGAVAATLSEGSSNSEITFTANTAGTAGNSITVAAVVSGDNTPLTVGVSSNAITINVATNGGGSATSTIAQVIAAIAASGPASALITATTTGNGTGTIGAFSATNLATGANASSTTTVAQLRSFVSTDPNSTLVTTSTTGNGTGDVAGVGFTSLSTGANAAATITLNSATIKNTSDGTNAILTLAPPSTSAIAVN